MVRQFLTMTLLLGVAAVAGCSGGGEGTAPTAKTAGVVTYKGTPVPNVSVTFTPASGRPANGVTDATGKFTLTTFNTGDGAVPGTHQVSITTTGEEPMPGTPEAAAAAKAPFPARYRNPQESGLTADVKPGTKNEFTFDMQD